MFQVPGFTVTNPFGDYYFNYAYGLSYNPIPAPGALAAFGLAAMIRRRRRR